jgi:F0F1-type ATP synthase assembly protein I
VSLSSIATLFVVLVATIVGLIGVANRGTTPWVLVVPLIVGIYAILTIREA